MGIIHKFLTPAPLGHICHDVLALSFTLENQA